MTIARMTHDFSADFLRTARILPMRLDSDTVIVGTWAESVDVQTVDDLRIAFLAEPTFVPIDEDEALEVIQREYATDPATAKDVIAGFEESTADVVVAEGAIDDLVSMANEAPVVRLVNFLLVEALQARASDVHIEGTRGGLRVRYRIDGVLQDVASPPGALGAAVVSRLKIMAEMDIAERRVPQDARIRLRLQDRDVDVRVSTLPALNGESVVLRLLDKQGGRLRLRDMGMAPETLSRFEEVLTRPHGIVLSTGPTGSGKTTTLYAAIDHLRTGREKILTVEDPVEYELAGVTQTAVNGRVGLTFATALRALLRQDPDVMLVGEIRDGETAEIATHAALTGHLVLSTLHTNDAPSALIRLVDLGIEPYLVASTVEAVLAQRLVRRVCERCKEGYRPADQELESLALRTEDLSVAWRGVGCDACRGTGYYGRTGLYELLVMDGAMAEAIHRRSGVQRLREAAGAGGMSTLREDGIRVIRGGESTIDEVLRISHVTKLAAAGIESQMLFP